MRPNTAFNLENTPAQNPDLYVSFCYETETGFTCLLKIKVYMSPFPMRPKAAFTLQNMPYEDQDLYVPFYYETGH